MSDGMRFLSRSFCYTMWSAIGIILSSVCLSVRRLSVKLYIVLSVSVYRA